MKKISKEIIEQIESDASRDEAFFSYRVTEEDQDNEHIEANEDGLKTFAAFLLRIAYGYEVDKPPQAEDDIFPIDKSLTLLERGWLVHYIKLIDSKRSDLESKKLDQKKSLKDKLFEIGCFAALILAAICSIIGLVAIFLWIF